MISTLALGLQALSSRQAKWVLAFILVAVFALLAGLILLFLVHGVSFGAQPPLVCGAGDGGCPS